MRGRIGFVVLFVLVLTMTFSITTIKPTYFAEAQRIPNQYIVVLKNNAADPETVAKDMALAHGLGLGSIYGHALKGFSAVIPDSVLEKVRNDPRVSFVEQDQLVETFVLQPFHHQPGHEGGKSRPAPTQPSETTPTGINRIDAERSIARTVDVDIAIIDTGIDLKHPDLNVLRGVTCSGAGAPGGNDDNGHGTHVAGTAAAKDNDIGVVGVASSAKLWAVKVLDKSGSGTISCVIAGIDYVTANAAEIEVANMSLGCACSTEAGDIAINNSVAAGVTYAVAAGNSAKNVSGFWPASNPNVITVSAIADSDGRCGGLGDATNYGVDDTFATFSNFGVGVDLAAPGVNILSTYKGQTYKILSGTSMASPHVAGAAGLYKASNSGASPAQIQDALTTLGILQTKACDTTLNNGNGGFTLDPDAFPEPLVYTASL
ncbi:MAG: S8 family peptidase [Nitrosopumilaceae archaeon]